VGCQRWISEWSSLQWQALRPYNLLDLGRRSQGIGSEILSVEVARAETLDRPVRIHVLMQSRARDFYRKNGFVETSRDEVFVDMESSPRQVTGGV